MAELLDVLAHLPMSLAQVFDVHQKNDRIVEAIGFDELIIFN
jgi:hypothetical protein